MVALHVADGSEILSQTAKGPSLKVFVGAGRARALRLVPARAWPRPPLADGFLPILETQYVDAAGTRYRQESFAVRGLGTGDLVSFVRLTADARARQGRRHPARPGGLAARRARGAGHACGCGSSPASRRPLYGGWLVPFGGSPGRDRRGDLRRRPAAAGRLLARSGSASSRRTTSPSSVVMDAQRSLLIQDLALTWRYSVGNQYEEFSFAEALDAAEVMAEYGLPGVTQADPAQLARPPRRRHVELADGREADRRRALLRLSGDREYLDQRHADARPDRRGRSAGRSARGHGGLLRRERYSSDVAARVYGLHAQAAVWQGLNAIADVWRATRAHRARPQGARARASRSAAACTARSAAPRTG